MSLGDLVDAIVAAVPLRPAIITPDDVVCTYEDLDRRACAYQAALADAGARQAERVALADAAGVAFTAALIGAWRAGCVPVLLNGEWTDREMAAAAAAAGCGGIAVAGPAQAEALERALHATVITRERAASTGRGQASPRIGRADEQDAVVLFTSGTTGVPKAVGVPHGVLEARLGSIALPFDSAVEPTVRMVSVPLFHVAGLVGLLRNLVSGVVTVLQPRFGAGDWLRLVERHRVSAAFCVPTMLRRILDHPDFASTDLSSLRTIAYGAAPAPPSLVQRAVRSLPGVAFSGTYGQTETLGGVAALTPDDHRDPRLLSSLGRPRDGVEVRIVDPATGMDVTAGDVGELWVRAAQTVRPGWQRTGDLGRVDAGGYLFLEGRLTDVINRGGEKIAPLEIEEVMRGHPDVIDVAVTGVPDEEMGQRVGIAVAARRPMSAQEIRDHCAERLARYKVPEITVFVDALPENALGKVDRRALATLFRDTPA